MEINNNSSIIKEVLSLRYCPSIKSTKNKFIVNDFMPEEKLDYLKHIENCISSEIKKEVSDNPVSVALSGDGKNGFFIQNTHELAEKIILLLNQPKQVEVMGANSLEMVQKFSWDKVVKTIIEEVKRN